MTRRLRDIRDALTSIHEIRRVHKENLQKLQVNCRHAWKLHSHYAKPPEGKGPVLWWIHLVCKKCEVGLSELKKKPICAKCLQPLVAARNKHVHAAAKKTDKYATRVFVFRCETCCIFYGFPARLDRKKKKK